MLALGKTLYVGSLHFRMMTITDRRMAHKQVIFVLSLAPCTFVHDFFFFCWGGGGGNSMLAL